MNCKNKIIAKNHQPIFDDMEIGVLATTLRREIEQQCEPLFKYWDSSFDKDNYMVTFNSVRILMPILEMSSKIEYGGDVPKLLKKLIVPEPKISWFMFRHGLMHSIRPFKVQYKDKIFGWGIKQYKGNHHINSDNLISISPDKLLEDLKYYLQGFTGNTKKVKIQTSVELYKI